MTDSNGSETDGCPVCGEPFVRTVDVGGNGKTGVDSVSVRDDFTACREKKTKLVGGHGNWEEETVVRVFVHRPPSADTQAD